MTFLFRPPIPKKKLTPMILTDWHHLFGMLLTDFFNDTSYKVELEKELTLKK